MTAAFFFFFHNHQFLDDNDDFLFFSAMVAHIDPPSHRRDSALYAVRFKEHGEFTSDRSTFTSDILAVEGRPFPCAAARVQRKNAACRWNEGIAYPAKAGMKGMSV